MYVGRFAPSPTGPLHFGSLIAAVASYLEARVHNGQWLVRIEDLDKPREVAGAANLILNTLRTFGFQWDGTVMYQSQRIEHYEKALSILKNKHLVYPCTCTRKEISDSAFMHGIEGAIYPQTCLHHAIKKNHPIAWRVKTADKTFAFKDIVQGNVSQNILHDVGDFVLKRADGFFAYQLAVVVDDEAQGITDIVRGADLLNSTGRQQYLQYLFRFNQPNYLHIPVAVNKEGQKLSKQTLALALNAQDTVSQLWDALHFLNQNPPLALKAESLTSCWGWALSNWDITKIPKQTSIQYTQSND